MANKVYITNNQKAVKVPSGTRMLIRRCVNAVVEVENFEHDVEVSVTFLDNEGIKELNAQYRNKDAATDVLSFPQFDVDEEFIENEETGCVMLGDIVISVERAMAQAEEYNHSLQREIAFLTVHSMLHLLGYDHENGGLEQVRMREKEELVLTKLGLPRGYNYVAEDAND